MPADSGTRYSPSKVAIRHKMVAGWGGGDRAPVSLMQPHDVEALVDAVDLIEPPGGIARGLGRSYGDAAQLSDGYVVDTTALRDFNCDTVSGTVTAQAGVTIGELLDALLPRGWMLPVVPGTRHVTVGGAIASDIHGKSHQVAGSFGSHVEALGLLTSDGEMVELQPGRRDGLFEATLGGMGLTGIVAWARISLMPVTSPMLTVDSDRVSGLDEALSALRAPGGQYRVAWIDLLGSPPCRGVVTRAGHAGESDHPLAPDRPHTRTPRLAIPRWWPVSVLRPSVVRALNELRLRRSPRRERGRIEHVDSHMFPLDAVDHWSRLYGPRGLVQYQFAVPTSQEHVLGEVIATLRRARVPCYLATLKDLGPSNGAPLSFPIEGWTLALDLPRAAPGLKACLGHCDRLVADAGGRVYLTKDSRLEPGLLRAMYPGLERWQDTRDRADPDQLWCSDLALRTGLVGQAR